MEKIEKKSCIEKPCQHLAKCFISAVFTIGTICFLLLLFYTSSFYTTEMRGLILGNDVHSVGGSSLLEDRNIIYLFDEDTRSLGNNNFKKQSVSPFDDLTIILKAIHNTDKERPIKLIVSTNGGNLITCKNIIRHLRLHPSGYIVYANEAFSAGSLVSISAQEIVMNSYSFLGKIDPIVGGQQQIIYNAFYSPNSSLIIGENGTVYKMTELDYEIRRSQLAMKTMEKILKEFVPEYERLRGVIRDNLIYSELLHSDSFNREELLGMGFNVRSPKEGEEIYFGYFQAK